MTTYKPPADRVEEIREEQRRGVGDTWENVEALLAAYDSLRQELEAVTAERDRDVLAGKYWEDLCRCQAELAGVVEAAGEVDCIGTPRELMEAACVELVELRSKVEDYKEARDEAYRKGAEDQREKIANCFDDKGQERPPPFYEDLYGEVMNIELPTPDQEGG